MTYINNGQLFVVDGFLRTYDKGCFECNELNPIRKKFKQAISDTNSENRIPLMKLINVIKLDLESVQDLALRTGIKSPYAKSEDLTQLSEVELGGAHKGLKDVKLDMGNSRPSPVVKAKGVQQASKKGKGIE